MRILHFSTIEGWGGGEQQLIWLVEGLARLGVESLVVCATGSFLEKKCVELSLPHRSWPRRSPFFLKNAWLLKRLCLEFQPSILHLHDANAHSTTVLAATFFGKMPPMILSRKVIFSIKNNFFTRWKYNHATIRRILCVSEAARKVLENRIKNAADRLVVVHDGCDLERTKPIKTGRLRETFFLEKSAFVIGTAAALNAAKDPFTFVKTAEKLLADGLDATFILFGEGPLRPAVEALILEKNLSKRVILDGFRADLPQFLPDLDLFLFTSKSEGLGSVLLDVFGARVPVVATSVGGIPELIFHEKTGLLAPSGRADLLAEQVWRLVREPDLAARLVETAFRFRANFSVEKMVERTLTVYRAVAEEEN